MKIIDRLLSVFAPPVRQPDGLISVLLDLTAEYGDRDDAAMDLGAYDSPQVVDALVRVATDSSEDPELQDSCGESLAAVVSRRAELSVAEFTGLCPQARSIFVSYLRELRPEWSDLLTRLLDHDVANQ